MYTYNWYQWLAFFFLYCFFGWIFESTYVSLKSGHFVNRGFLRLPMLPLYGTGAIMMLWVSIPVKDNLLLVYILGVAAATVLEYVTGYMMERLFKVKYWDYSNQHFQLHGYICLSSSIAWGFLTILLTEVIHKPIELFVLRINPVFEITLVLAIGTMFLLDTLQSTKDALDLAKVLESMTNIKAELEDLQVQAALLKAETKQMVTELKEETVQKIADMKEDAQEIFATLDLKASKAEDEIQQKIMLLKEKRQEIFIRLGVHKARLLKNNPSASSGRFSEALKDIKESLNLIRK